MEPTVPDTSKDANFASFMSTIGTAVADMATHQAAAARHASDASVEVAKVEANRQIELARIESSRQEKALSHGVHVLYVVMGLVTCLVVASFATGHHEIATHTITAAAGIAAGWLARSKR